MLQHLDACESGLHNIDCFPVNNHLDGYSHQFNPELRVNDEQRNSRHGTYSKLYFVVVSGFEILFNTAGGGARIFPVREKPSEFGNRIEQSG